MKVHFYNTNYEMTTPAALRVGSFLPLAFETSGAMDDATHKFLAHLARTSRGVSTMGDYAARVSTILQRVSVTLQKGNARMILHWQAAAFAPAALAAQGQAALQLAAA